MRPWLSDPDLDLYVGDCRDVLADLAPASADCIVTSPPYWGLRDYDEAAQIGLEESLEDYVAELVQVFREARRVLSPTGTLWLNLGDAFSSGSSGLRTKGMNGRLGRSSGAAKQGQADTARPPVRNLPPKNLLGMPWRVAFALQEDGWILRADVVWSKPDAMPESARDRPTRSHEFVFMFVKQARYYFAQERVREPFQTVPQNRFTSTAEQPKGAAREAAGVQNPTSQGTGLLLPPQETTLFGEPEAPRGPDGRRVMTRTTSTRSHENYGELDHADGRERWPHDGRNVRTVWAIPTESYAEAHFATYPVALARKCLLASCPDGGTVLDPFAGAGTTAVAARALGLRSILVELNEEYAEMIGRRLQQQSLLA